MQNSSLILSIIKQAKQTFANIVATNNVNYDDNDQIDSLKRSMNKLTKYDLNFTLFDHLQHSSQNLNSIEQKNLDRFRHSSAPVFYMKLYEDSIISVGIFIIKSHHRIPLHDHPHMFGLIKVLDGQGHLNAYNVQLEKNANELVCTKHVSTTISSQSETAVIYPKKSNIHEIYASQNEHCAFLDILSPPYSNENDCTCYMAIPSGPSTTTTTESNENNYILKRIFDDEYYTESLQYTGPTIFL